MERNLIPKENGGWESTPNSGLCYDCRYSGLRNHTECLIASQLGEPAIFEMVKNNLSNHNCTDYKPFLNRDREPISGKEYRGELHYE